MKMKISTNSQSKKSLLNKTKIITVMIVIEAYISHLLQSFESIIQVYLSFLFDQTSIMGLISMAAYF